MILVFLDDSYRDNTLHFCKNSSESFWSVNGSQCMSIEKKTKIWVDKIILIQVFAFFLYWHFTIPWHFTINVRNCEIIEFRYQYTIFVTILTEFPLLFWPIQQQLFMCSWNHLKNFEKNKKFLLKNFKVKRVPKVCLVKIF